MDLESFIRYYIIIIVIRDNNTNNNKLIKKKKTDWEDEPDTKKLKNTLKEVDLCSLSVNILGTTHLYGISRSPVAC